MLVMHEVAAGPFDLDAPAVHFGSPAELAAARARHISVCFAHRSLSGAGECVQLSHSGAEQVRGRRGFQLPRRAVRSLAWSFQSHSRVDGRPQLQGFARRRLEQMIAEVPPGSLT